MEKKHFGIQTLLYEVETYTSCPLWRIMTIVMSSIWSPYWCKVYWIFDCDYGWILGVSLHQNKWEIMSPFYFSCQGGSLVSVSTSYQTSIFRMTVSFTHNIWSENFEWLLKELFKRAKIAALGTILCQNVYDEIWCTKANFHQNPTTHSGITKMSHSRWQAVHLLAARSFKQLEFERSRYFKLVKRNEQNQYTSNKTIHNGKFFWKNLRNNSIKVIGFCKIYNQPIPSQCSTLLK